MNSVVHAGRTALTAAAILLATLVPTTLAGPAGPGAANLDGSRTDAPPAHVLASDEGSVCVACWD